MNDISLPAGEFKATCLKLMDEVAATGRSVTITKRGKPVARLVPVDDARIPRAGSLAHTIEILGDIEAPLYDVVDPVAKFDRIEALLAVHEQTRAYPAARRGRTRSP
ncbi:MAG: type II toxin-antitoxin system Phd/YefM family antitoxin [Panacagrimonas sp.]